jgi:hypothetical protein
MALSLSTRLVLGVAQMVGATAALSLVVREGLTQRTASVAAATTLVTVFSLALRGPRGRR